LFFTCVIATTCGYIPSPASSTGGFAMLALINVLGDGTDIGNKEPSILPPDSTPVSSPPSINATTY
jgi:hypothetical protein